MFESKHRTTLDVLFKLKDEGKPDSALAEGVLVQRATGI